MHEMSVAEEIVRQVTIIACENNAQSVSSVEVVAGALRLIEPDAMQAAFKAATEGTAAEGATLVLREVLARARCRSCDLEFDIDSPTDFTCSKCGQADTEVTAGNDIVLQSVEIEASPTGTGERQ